MFGLHARLVPTLRILVVPAQCLGQPRNRQVPRAPLPASGVTSGGEMSSILSEGVTPPSSLLRTHAPDQNPPANFGFLFRPVLAGCRQPLLEDGPSRRYLHNLCEGAWTHTPQRSLVLSVWSPCRKQRSTSYQGHRPRLRVQGLGTPDDPCNATSTGDEISGLQSFANVQAPSLARPSGCTYHCAEHRAAGPFTSRNEHVVTRLDRSRFYMNCDIATYPKRTN